MDCHKLPKLDIFSHHVDKDNKLEQAQGEDPTHASTPVGGARH